MKPRSRAGAAARDSAPGSATRSPASGRRRPGADGHPLLRLQELAGNRATLALLGRERAAAPEAAEHEPEAARDEFEAAAPEGEAAERQPEAAETKLEAEETEPEAEEAGPEQAAEPMTRGRPLGRLRRITGRLRRHLRRFLGEKDPAEQATRGATIAALYAEGAAIVAEEPPATDTPGRERRTGRVWSRLLLDPLEAARRTYRRRLKRAEPSERGGLFGRYVELLELIRSGTRALVGALPEELAATVGPGAEAELQVAWIEASPTTAAALDRQTDFGAADQAAAERYEQVLEAYLDDLLISLPGSDLAVDERNRIHTRLLAALRRAYVTLEPGPGGRIDPARISNPRIAAKYQEVSAELVDQGAERPTEIIMHDLTYNVPDETPKIELPIAADLAQVPAREQLFVQIGIQAALDVAARSTEITLVDAVWPVTFQIHRDEDAIQVRYELVFDRQGDVRVERLGEVGPREVAPAFAGLSLADKKAHLIAELDLAGIDDRPADPDSGREEARWEEHELDQVKAAFDRVPPDHRAMLAGYALVREKEILHEDSGASLTGLVHTQESDHYDKPKKPAHEPPHMHIADRAFYKGDALDSRSLFVGAPGDVGPSAEQTLLHEVGHVVVADPTRTRNPRVRRLNDLEPAFIARPEALYGEVRYSTNRQREAILAWRSAEPVAHEAIVAFTEELETEPPSDERLAELLEQARDAIAARDAARAELAASKFGSEIVDAATAHGRAQDDYFAQAQLVGTRPQEIAIFSKLADDFDFLPFTQYGREEGAEEFFAETYSLFLSDPDRLNAMNRRMFLWFAEGMPQEREWEPPE